MPERDVTIGGQAVIEGVMMKSPQLVVTTVRRANGEMVSKIETQLVGNESTGSQISRAIEMMARMHGGSGGEGVGR